MASKNAKQVENIVKELGNVGKSLEKALGLFEGAVAAESKAAMASNKIVNDKFKTLTKTLGLQKESNEYYKAANNITKKLNQKSSKLTNEEKKQLELHRKQLNVMGKIDGVAKDISEQYGMQASALKNGVKQARLLLNPILALSGALALSVKRFFELEKLGKGTARASGLLAGNTLEFQNAIKDVQPELIAFGASVDDISKASATVADNFGFLDAETADIVSSSVKIGTAFGIQADTMINVVSQARLLGASMQDIDQFTNDVINSGLQVNKVFEDLSKVSGDTGAILAGNTKQLMNQVLEARRLGLNLNDIANTQSLSSGLQSMFQDQMKASVLFGRSINLVESNRLKMQGKFVEASEMNLAMITGSIDPLKQINAIENMGFFQKKELERIEGRTADQIIKDKRRQLFLDGKLTGEAADQVASEISRERMLQRQLNLQDKLSALFTRLGIKIGEQLLPFITSFAEKLEDLLAEPDKLNKLLDKTVGYLKNALFILTAMKGLSFAGNLAMLFGGVGSGPAGIKMFQNTFMGTAKRTASGALDARATRMNAIGSGAKLLRGLGPAVTGFMVASDIFRAATTKDAKDRKKFLGGGIGGAIGGAIGLIGGPAGAAIGMGLGQFAGRAIGKYFSDRADDIKESGKDAIKTAFGQIERMATQKKLKVFKDIDNIVDTLAGKKVTPEMIDSVFKGLKNLGASTENVQKAFDEVGIKEGVTPSVDALAELAKILKGDDGVNKLLGKYKKNLQGVLDAELKRAGIGKAQEDRTIAQQALTTAFSENNLKAIAIELGETLGTGDLMGMGFQQMLNAITEAQPDDFMKRSGRSKAEMASDLFMNQIAKDLEMNIKAQGGDLGAFLKDIGEESVQDFVKKQLVKTTIADPSDPYSLTTTKRSFVDPLTMFGSSFKADKILEALPEISELALKLVDEQLSRKTREAVKVASGRMSEVDAEDFTIKAHPADTITVMGGTQIGNDVVEKLDQVITAINNMGGDIIMDGRKVGRRIAENQ